MTPLDIRYQAHRNGNIVCQAMSNQGFSQTQTAKKPFINMLMHFSSAKTNTGKPLTHSIHDAISVTEGERVNKKVALIDHL
ncbi:Uncharacterised protein [Yersinia enterocolitica]|nr:Uncharacterised protein [Yersinia enterocolitica]